MGGNNVTEATPPPLLPLSHWWKEGHYITHRILLRRHELQGERGASTNECWQSFVSKWCLDSEKSTLIRDGCCVREKQSVVSSVQGRSNISPLIGGLMNISGHWSCGWLTEDVIGSNAWSELAAPVFQEMNCQVVWEMGHYYINSANIWWFQPLRCIKAYTYIYILNYDIIY